MGISLNKKRAFSEVDAFLTTLGKSYINKIPKDILDVIKSEKDESYKVKIDPDISIESQDFSREAISIILWLNLEFFCNDEQKELLEKIYSNNQKLYEKEQKEKYSVENIFPKNNEKNNEKNNSLVKKEKQNLFKRILKYINNLFKNKLLNLRDE